MDLELSQLKVKQAVRAKVSGPPQQRAPEKSEPPRRSHVATASVMTSTVLELVTRTLYGAEKPAAW